MGRPSRPVPLSGVTDPALATGTLRAVWLAFGLLGLTLSPVLVAIWAVPWFVTQDGPAHLYNAQVVAESFDPDSPFRNYYAIQWQPIPNWSGHLLLAALLQFLPAWVADRLITSLTLAGFSASVLWLRWRVAGERGLGVAALYSGLLAMNVTWLFGFTNFMLGACLFPITMGYWWRHRDELGVRQIVILGILLALGYFCHLVSLGLTAVSLLLLAVCATPVRDAASKGDGRSRIKRLAMTTLSMVPAALLMSCYFQMSSRGGPLWPDWKHLENPLSFASWRVQLTWVDPLTLSRKVSLPFSDYEGVAFACLAPTLWLAASLGLWWIRRLTDRTLSSPDRRDPSSVTGRDTADGREWLWLAVLLIVGGIASPDSLGPGHGNYLPQRVCLIGLVCLAPVFELNSKRWLNRFALLALGGAFVLQSGIVWDYALYSDRTAGQIIRARTLVGNHQRVASLLVSTRCKFRVNPLLHADHWLGVGNGNIIWNDYETQHYYFPVQFVTTLDRPDARALELISLAEGSNESLERALAWESMLKRHARSIDVLLVWKRDPRLDKVTERYFRCVQERGDVRIFERVAETAMRQD